MNRYSAAFLPLVLLVFVLAGNLSAGDVDPQDVAFVGTGWSSASSSPQPDPQAWASAGVVLQSDYAFVNRSTDPAGDRGPEPIRGPVATIEGADYRFIAGDGSPGATCDIALVAAIRPGC